jgi:hypothetical protein
MIRAALLAAGLLLSACAQPQPVAVLPVQPIDPVITPVDFKDLRGQSVMVLDRQEPDFVVQRMTTYLRQCKTGPGERLSFRPHSVSLLGANNAPRLSLMIAQRGPVTGVALDGPDFNPEVQEELVQAVEGRSTCL